MVRHGANRRRKPRKHDRKVLFSPRESDQPTVRILECETQRDAAACTTSTRASAKTPAIANDTQSACITTRTRNARRAMLVILRVSPHRRRDHLAASAGEPCANLCRQRFVSVRECSLQRTLRGMGGQLPGGRQRRTPSPTHRALPDSRPVPTCWQTRPVAGFSRALDAVIRREHGCEVEREHQTVGRCATARRHCARRLASGDFAKSGSTRLPSAPSSPARVARARRVFRWCSRRRHLAVTSSRRPEIVTGSHMIGATRDYRGMLYRRVGSASNTSG